MNYEIFIYLIFITLCLMIAWIYSIQRLLFKLESKIRQLESEDNKTNRQIKRTHSKIKPVSFSNIIQPRQNPYKDYQNTDGLYEPITPKKVKRKENK